MRKLLALVVVMLLPLGVFAQDKIAVVYAQEIMVLMPEYTEMVNKVNELQGSYQKELQGMEEEFQKKYTAFMEEQETLTENIRLRRMQEVEDLRNRIQTTYQMAEEDIQKKGQELSMPIYEKLNNTIKAVGEEKGYLYIAEPTALRYINTNKVEDATPFVKAKLGL